MFLFFFIKQFLKVQKLFSEILLAQFHNLVGHKGRHGWSWHCHLSWWGWNDSRLHVLHTDLPIVWTGEAQQMANSLLTSMESLKEWSSTLWTISIWFQSRGSSFFYLYWHMTSIVDPTPDHTSHAPTSDSKHACQCSPQNGSGRSVELTKTSLFGVPVHPGSCSPRHWHFCSFTRRSFFL